MKNRIKLSEIVDIDIGKTPSRNNPKYWDKDKKNSNVWVSIRDMSALKGIYIDDSREYVSNEGAELFKEVPKETLIMSFKLSIGKLAITKINLRTNEAIAAFKIKDYSLICNEYLYYYLSSINWGKLAGDDIKLKGKTLNKEKLKNIFISLPTLKIQKQIVNRLDGLVNKINENLKIEQKKNEEINKLKEKILFNEFNLIKEKKKLSEVCEIFNGGTPDTKKKIYWGGENQWLTPRDMGKMNNEYTQTSSRQITNKGIENSSANLIPKNSLILSSRAPIGHLAINTVPMAFNQGCKGLVVKSMLLNKYLYYFLLSSKKVLNELGTGTTFKEVSGKKLNNLIISVTSVENQKKIIEKFDLIFKKINVMKDINEKKIQNYIKLKDSLIKKEVVYE